MACDGGCTGASRFNCVQCKNGWKAIEGQQGCEGIITLCLYSPGLAQSLMDA